MKKSNLIIIVFVAIVGLVAVWMIQCYNAFVTQEENVEQSWGQVENQYQRRMDLVPNLVSTVKAAAKTEHDNFTDVIEARAKATSVSIDASTLTEDNLALFQQTQGELSQALSRLMAVAESYPDLKTNQNYRDLMTQLEGTENRITVARNAFNDCAKNYNMILRRFPNNIIASLFNFEYKPYFKSETGAEKAPIVKFD